jgi:hypothetical protein
MKISLAIAMCVASAVPVLALAEAPMTAPTVGALMSVVNYCGQVDPRHEQQMEKVAGKLMKGVSDKDVKRMKQTTEFKSGYDLIDGVLRGLAKEDGVRLCAAALN